MNLFTITEKFILVLVVVAATGCTTARIEYDRMTGTQYPQPETVSGEEVNLTTIYWQGEKLISVDENTTNIAPLTGTINPADPNEFDYIDPSEPASLHQS